MSIDFLCLFLYSEMFILYIYPKTLLGILLYNFKNIIYFLKFRFHPVNASIIIFYYYYIKLYMRKKLVIFIFFLMLYLYSPLFRRKRIVFFLYSSFSLSTSEIGIGEIWCWRFRQAVKASYLLVFV